MTTFNLWLYGTRDDTQPVTKCILWLIFQIEKYDIQGGKFYGKFLFISSPISPFFPLSSPPRPTFDSRRTGSLIHLQSKSNVDRIKQLQYKYPENSFPIRCDGFKYAIQERTVVIIMEFTTSKWAAMNDTVEYQRAHVQRSYSQKKWSEVIKKNKTYYLQPLVPLAAFRGRISTSHVLPRWRLCGKPRTQAPPWKKLSHMQTKINVPDKCPEHWCE